MQTSSIEVRPLRFAIDAGIPRHWHPAGAAVSAFFGNLSVFFPEGERFFIRCVRAHAGAVKDERLLADVRAFCGQEAIHGREHVRYNEWLREQGYPIDAMMERIMTEMRQKPADLRGLAITCALEHFTALMGQVALEDSRILEGAHPVMAALWRWHAAEENEHKAVAYDVYHAAGGTYVERVVVMAAVTVLFWSHVMQHQALMMKADGKVLDVREWAALTRFLFVEPGGLSRVFRRYWAYFRPGFHPNDVDSRPIVDAWKTTADAATLSGELETS
jgi:predicted metal-dependent hydrolase